MSAGVTVLKRNATILLPLLLACTPQADANEEPDSWEDLLEPVAGTRLRPIVRVADDGTRTHVGWQDTLLDTPCQFTKSSDGELRCLPKSTEDSLWLFADALCTQPVLQDINIPPGTTFIRERALDCSETPFYEVGDAVDTIYYADQGRCEFFSNDPSHRLIAVADDAFVGATVTPRAGRSRIVPMLLEADDGAQQIFGAWDREHEEEVTAAPDQTGQLRWFGRVEPEVSSHYFANADCTQPVAILSCVPESQTPTTARQREPGICGELTGRYALGELTETVYYKQDNGSCIPDALPTGFKQRIWRVESRLDDTAFAESSTQDGGGERLRHDIYRTPEGAPVLASGRVYDTQLSDVECRWKDPETHSRDPAPGLGSFDCIPSDAATLSGRYLDSDCTTPTATRWVYEESCPGEATHAYGGGLVSEIARSISSEGRYAHDEDNRCQSIGPSEPPDGGDIDFEWYAVEPATTPAVHATDVIE